MAISTVYEKSLWYDTSLLNHLRAKVDDIEAKIAQLASWENFSSQHNNNMNGKKLANLNVDESNES